MNTSSKITTLIVVASLLTACNQPMGRPGQGVTQGGSLNKQDVGTAAGAIAGGIAGYQFGGGAGKAVATVIGAGLGGLIGSSLGASLDKSDAMYAERAGQRALETGRSGEALPWRSSNASGSYTPSEPYQTASGQYCREYTQTITVGGRTEKGYGTACRQPDGSWKVIQ